MNTNRSFQGANWDFRAMKLVRFQAINRRLFFYLVRKRDKLQIIKFNMGTTKHTKLLVLELVAFKVYPFLLRSLCIKPSSIASPVDFC